METDGVSLFLTSLEFESWEMVWMSKAMMCLSHMHQTHTHKQTVSDVSHSFPKIRWQIYPMEKMTSQNFPNSHRYSHTCTLKATTPSHMHHSCFDLSEVTLSDLSSNHFLFLFIPTSPFLRNLPVQVRVLRSLMQPWQCGWACDCSSEKFLFRIFPQCIWWFLVFDLKGHSAQCQLWGNEAFKLGNSHQLIAISFMLTANSCTLHQLQHYLDVKIIHQII